MTNVWNMPDPLSRRVFRTIRDWSEWSHAWDNASNLPAFLGLLHHGFNVQALPEPGTGGEAIARLRFYLRLADGWAVRDISTEDDPRLKLRRKAADMLASHFFSHRKYTSQERRRPFPPLAWIDALQYDGFLQDLAWFFRPNPGSYSPATNVCNLPESGRDDNCSVRTRSFARELARGVWGFDADGNAITLAAKSSKSRELYAASRPGFLHLLSFFGDLTLLASPEAPELNDRAQGALLELALDRRYVYGPGQAAEVGSYLNFASLEEALQAGSAAAQLLIVLTAIGKCPALSA